MPLARKFKTDNPCIGEKARCSVERFVASRCNGFQEEEEIVYFINSRLTRLDKQITEKEKKQFTEKANGKKRFAGGERIIRMLFNPDVLDDIETKVRTEKAGAAPVESEAAIKAETEKLQNVSWYEAQVVAGDRFVDRGASHRGFHRGFRHLQAQGRGLALQAR